MGKRLTLTNAAAQRVKALLHQYPSALALRVSVKKTGCSGWSYALELADTIESADLVFDSEGVQLVTDVGSFEKLQGLQIDFVTTEVAEGFRFDNPNLVNQCGCGKSFQVADA